MRLGELARSRSRGWWIRVGLLVAVVIVVGVVALRPTSVPAFRASGQPVEVPPPGVLTPVTGDEFEGMLVSLRGRGVIVNVWASWCTPCRSEAPLLSRAARAQSAVVIVGVDSKDDLGAGRRFVDEFDMDYLNVFDAGAVRQRLDLRGFPTTYVFDRDGELVSTVIGALTERSLAGAIDSVS